MTRQMCWLPVGQKDDEKLLHLRMQPHQPWQPYQSFPQYAVPDYQVPGGSKGWATYQRLLREGWTLVSTATAQSQLVAHRQPSQPSHRY
ncbi:MAG: hypothetical protein KME12_10705 [Trichocoleus desertorum ATA4-8-CV12]|jgi:hypothetical protein|nr:hypothetical protein [Trichocoleus desertorum ATA4-8-CV12]